MTDQEKITIEIANNLEKLCDSVSALLKGPLNRRALLTLLAASTHMNQRTVNTVLEAIQNLKTDFLKK